MRYLVLLMDDGAEKVWTEQTPEEQAATMAKFGEFDAACAARDGVEILAGEALAGPEAATTVRTRDGRVQVTDGPYAEAVEGMGGFYLVQAPDLDGLLELLRVLPAYDIQVSPAVDMG
ncbi:YciI family protein [Nocardioides sp. STR2]|uniref:YciI family protein n=1 Tax=Nocardioides pini TaxID=2975053 RepID=A0ABT4CB90_9ACTN|nr:YciI family protein [Nocardioides pini]MCY4726235.1 YciI family protein [Nocardioides pini]